MSANAVSDRRERWTSPFRSLLVSRSEALKGGRDGNANTGAPRRPLIVALSLLALASGWLIAPATIEAQSRSWTIDILKDTFGITQQQQIEPDIDLVFQGCAQRDCIPSIDQPGYIPASDAFDLDDDDLVLGLVHGDVVRAYPVHILNHHEIVNDDVAGEPIAITYCPLCGSGVAFRRELGGQTVEFGVSGLLHNSDLILYDRTSESLWQQITGLAIAGPRRGEALVAVPLAMATWGEWRQAHPGTEVLAADRGRLLSVPDKQPYGDYDKNKRLLFPANSQAARLLHPKEVVFGVTLPEGKVAITQRRLLRDSPISVPLGGLQLTWTRQADGSVTVVREDDSTDVLAHRMFWFAWYSFNTDTALLDLER